MDLVIFGIAITIATGLIVMAALYFMQSDKSISLVEFLIGSVVLSFIVVPIISHVGTEMAKSSLLTYSEYWGGYEKEAVWIKTSCSRDGPCVHEYDCDSFPCNPHKCNCTCTSRDKDGSCTSESCSTCYDTCYHDCPYCTEEWTFVIKTTIGDVTIASGHFPDNPHANRWEPWRGQPLYQQVIDRAGVGVPDFWAKAKARIDSGTPGPVTMVKPYDNYILASQNTILKQFSDSIETYKKQGLLPTMSTGTRDYYFANKVYFVGMTPASANEWQMASMWFNAALGTELQGDLHLIVVKSDKVTNPDNYAGAALAYLQGPEMEKNALSKNGILVILGTTDGETVSWARASTGMPLGNNAMLLQIRNELPKTSLTPKAIFGDPRGQFYTNDEGKLKIRPVLSGSKLENIVWGSNKFKRVCMTCKDEGGVGFDVYLKNEIEPTAGQKILILIVTFLGGLPVWGVFAYIGERTWRSLYR